MGTLSYHGPKNFRHTYLVEPGGPTSSDSSYEKKGFSSSPRVANPLGGATLSELEHILGQFVRWLAELLVEAVGGGIAVGSGHNDFHILQER